jgi:hypothetical protein
MRKMNNLYMAALCAMALIVVKPIHGGPVSRATISALATQADAIVVGKLAANSSSGTITATIDIERMLKGSLKPGNQLVVQWSGPVWSTPDGRLPDDHGLFFLHQTGSGTWAFLPVMVGDIAWRDVFIQTPASVPATVRAAAAASMPPNPKPLDSVLLELVTAADAGARFSVDLVALYRSYRSPVLEAAFRRFSGGNDPWRIAAGVRGLISMGDPSVVHFIQQQHATMSATPFWPSALQELKVYYTSTDPTAIAALGALAVDTKAATDLRNAAAWALARVHTKAALPYLARLLSDPNPGLAAAGVGGLSSFANNVSIGSHEPASGAWKYRTDDTIAYSVFDESLVARRPAYYVGFWKTWWDQNQTELAK